MLSLAAAAATAGAGAAQEGEKDNGEIHNTGGCCFPPLSFNGTHLVGEARVLVPGLKQAPPHGVEVLVVLLQQRGVGCLDGHLLGLHRLQHLPQLRDLHLLSAALLLPAPQPQPLEPGPGVQPPDGLGGARSAVLCRSGCWQVHGSAVQRPGPQLPAASPR
jgi:hypothetical protein